MNVVPGGGRAALKRFGYATGRLAVSPLLRRRVADIAPSPGKALLIGVFSERNAGRVRPVVAQARGEGWAVRLRALDRPPPDLAPYTVATGPAERMRELYRLGADDAGGAAWIVAVDDDVAVPQGGLARLVALCERAELSVGQPGHHPRSEVSYPFTRSRPFSVVRDTGFVEAGPLICVRASWWERLMAPCVDFGHGWGAEALWAEQRSTGARLGIVDAVRIRHLDRPGLNYDQRPQQAQRDRQLLDRGFSSMAELQTTVATWHPWQRHAPWIAPSPHPVQR